MIAPIQLAQTIYFTTKNNLKLEGWYIPVVQLKELCLFHGHGGTKSGVYAMKQQAFRKFGYNTFQLDFRAHGNSEGNTCTIGYYETEDVKLAYDFIKNKGKKILCFGEYQWVQRLLLKRSMIILNPTKLFWKCLLVLY